MNLELEPWIVVTGATGGLGRKVVEGLLEQGKRVIAAGRRAEVVQALVERYGEDRCRPFVADLASLEQVRQALARLGSIPLAGVVANAGISTMKADTSEDGFELTFAVNVLAHQLILRSTFDQWVDGARVVIISSGVHDPDNKLARRAGIPVPRWVGTQNLARPDRARPEDRLDDGRLRYSTSKLGNVLQARALQAYARQVGKSVDVFALDPGLMVDTDLARELPAVLRGVFRGIGRMVTPWVSNMRLSTVSAGHVRSLLQDPSWSGRGFQYLDGDHVRPPSPDAMRDDFMHDLWGTSNQLVGWSSPELRAA